MKAPSLFPPRLSQEKLKLIACLTMLIDHVGVVLFPGIRWFRIAGRLAFPIYSFLLTEGLRHTRSPKKYFLRLCLGALICELPYDLALYSRVNLSSNSVMLTLVLGFLALYALQQADSIPSKLTAIFAVPVCYLLAGRMHTDYGGNGVLMILAFGAAQMLQLPKLWQAVLVGFAAWRIGGFRVHCGSLSIPVELFGLLALPLIWCYSGEKRWDSKKLSALFYSFYPGHLAILYIIKLLAGR